MPKKKTIPDPLVGVVAGVERKPHATLGRITRIEVVAPGDHPAWLGKKVRVEVVDDAD